jgi:hypothetical protein
MLYRSTDRLRRCGAPVQYLSHSASFHSLEKYAPPNAGTKHLAETPEFGKFEVRRPARTGEVAENPGTLFRELQTLLRRSMPLPLHCSICIGSHSSSRFYSQL